MTIPVVGSGGSDGRRITLGDLVFNDGAIDENGIEYYVTNLDGWDGAEVKSDIIDKPRADGEFDSSSFYAARSIVMTGWLGGSTQEALREARDRLIEATDLVTDRALLVVDDTPSRQALVRLGGRVLVDENLAGSLVFQVPLRAADPRKYGTVERTLTLEAGETGVAANIGRFRRGAPLQIVLRGPLTAPQLVVGDQVLSFHDISAATTLTIDGIADTILLQDGTSGFSLVDGSLKIPTLPPRTSTDVGLFGIGAGSVELSWRDTWR